MNTVIASAVTGELAVMLALNQMWYQDYGQTNFHFFDDKDEWLQMDKFGHVYTAYWLGYFGNKALLWTKLEEPSTVWYSSLYSLSFMTTIEVFDGFSTEWGFSLTDMASNIGGVALFASQQLGWKEQRIRLKYSYYNSNYAGYRPSLLGKSMYERPLKDYNGMTYWLTFNLSSFMGRNSPFPKWLNIAAGYGGNAMISGKDDPALMEKLGLLYFKRYRQYYLSLDFDFSKVRFKKFRWVNTIFELLNTVKVPFPAIEYNSIDGIKVLPIAF